MLVEARKDHMKRVILAAAVAALSFVGFADVTEPIPSPEPGIPLNVRTGLPPEIRQMTMLVGELKGPAMFELTSVLGKEETLRRIDYALSILK